MLILETRSEVNVTVTQGWVRDTSSSKDAPSQQIWDSYVK